MTTVVVSDAQAELLKTLDIDGLADLARELVTELVLDEGTEERRGDRATLLACIGRMAEVADGLRNEVIEANERSADIGGSQD